MRFDANELYTMAIALERNGQRFYREAAGRFAEPRLRGVLLLLAEMEVKHEQFFADLRARSATGPAAPQADGEEHEEYLQALVDAHVFSDGPAGATVPAAAGIHEILQFALAREKETVVFYLTMKNMLSPWAGGADLDAIVNEEVKHVQMITAELRRLAQETGPAGKQS